MPSKEYILILGGTRGLGQKLVEIWLEQGKKVIVLGSSAVEDKNLLAAFKDGLTKICVCCDLSAPLNSKTGALTTVDRLQEIFAEMPEVKITGFCWNAGSLRRVTFENASEQELLRATDLNYGHPLLFARWIWLHMKEHKRPSFFSIIASTTGLSDVPKADEVLYAPLKAAQVSFARAIGKSNSIESSIRVALFCPGGMNTEFWDGNGLDPLLLAQFLDPVKVATLITEKIETQKASYEELTIPRGSL